jgi:hypothetical protein
VPTSNNTKKKKKKKKKTHTPDLLNGVHLARATFFSDTCFFTAFSLIVHLYSMVIFMGWLCRQGGGGGEKECRL